jgi:hypothetical protein
MSGELTDAERAFTAAAELEVLRLLRAWGAITTTVEPRMRRVIEAALLLVTVDALLGGEEEDDGRTSRRAAGDKAANQASD